MTASDPDIMARLQAGERAAFAHLVERYQKLVYGYLRARVRSAADAEDMTQEVFLRSYQARARFDLGSLVQPWLLGIARNLLREHVRRHRRRHEIAWTELCLELETTAPPDLGSIDDHLIWLPQCLAELGPSAREAIDGHYRLELKLSEIAETQHRSEGAVKLLLHRARQALRDCLHFKRQRSLRS
ncbi:sigma-70 family RNA polymerase sigma factor [bacterium]|nr:sigma-70 family RNA polymerase sigma factor [bacterium]